MAAAGPMIRLGPVEEVTSILAEAMDLGPDVWQGRHLDIAMARLAETRLDSAFATIREALDLYERSRAVVVGGPDPLREAPYLSGVATCWIRLGDLDAAQATYGRALQLVESSGDLDRKAEVYGNIGTLASIIANVEVKEGHLENAVSGYAKARELLTLLKPATDPYLGLIERHEATVRRKLQRHPGI